jgi:flagellar hook-associated protein 1 FlgK
MAGIGTILDIGKKALFASQTSLEVTSNNIANVNTEGYHRQEVLLEESPALNLNPGQIGTGVDAKEVIRHFDQFIENQYNIQAGEREMWDKLNQSLGDVEILFDESGSGGTNAALAQFFQNWQDLSVSPDSQSMRTALLGNSETLVRTVNQTVNNLKDIQGQMDNYISQDVERVNEIIDEIAKINKQINIHEVEGQINANALRDKRDKLVRELGEKMDIKYIDNGMGDVTILTKAGHTLVDGQDTFRLAFEGPQSFADLQPGSGFDGKIYFQGSSSREYKIEITSDGEEPNPSGNATFRVSADGGRTWLKDENGNTEFTASNYDNRVKIPGSDVEVWFGPSDDSGGTASTSLSEGDSFSLVPKKGLYWYKNTSSKVNVTPQKMPNGLDNERRITSGSLAGYFNFRDSNVGEYEEKLNAFAESLAWEVNRQHSQGAGEQKFSSVLGTYSTLNQGEPLANAGSGLEFGDKLESGNLMFYVYDSNGDLSSSGPLDFGGAGGIQNFDPSTHSLEDVRDAFDSVGNINASIVNGRLQLEATGGHEFAFGSDTSGLLAGLGLNTYFEGTNATNLALNSQVRNNVAFINAGHVNGENESNSGDNTIARAIANLQEKKVSISTISEGTTNQTLQEYYDSLVGKVGADKDMADFNYQYNKSLAEDLNSRQQEVSGVNMDEEMTSLIKFQQSYQAAAKLITTADRMVQTLLSIRP